MNSNSLNTNQRSEKGQNVVLIALLMMVFIGLLALVLDGGFSYASRRSAQNAADAGALAGANILCSTSGGDAYAEAWEYAVTRNAAVDADIAIAEKVITVTATIPHQTFFAGLIGQNVVTTTATATAGCFSPCLGEGVLPVAWACTPPAGADPEDDCEIQPGTIDEPGPLYIIMDSEKAADDYICAYPPNPDPLPPGILDCDFDNDGEDDLIVGGGRSWLDLDGGSGDANELKTWITEGQGGDIPVHVWLSGITGNMEVAYQAAADRVGDIVLVPVFNDYTLDCDPEPTTSGCHGQWHSGSDIEFASDGTSTDYYHVISFSAFIITGVAEGNQCAPHHGDCVARDALVAQGFYDNPHSLRAIEGYFIEGYVPGLGGKCDYDAGAYTIYLDH
jgi:hypothetical protein